jgi:Spy/CpxP family protein refolding chaperone
MIGFILGAVAAVGVAKVVRARRRGMWGRGFGGPGFGRRRWFLRALFERLDTTPGQERAIVALLDELSQNRKAVREEFGQTRAELAHAVEGGLIDDATLDEAFARHDRLAAQLRVAFIEALKKTTEVLDERQRKQVARLLAGRAFFSGGPVWA